MEHRIGKFYITNCLLRTEPSQLSQILSLLKFVPYRVESLLYKDMVEYIGYSPKFDEVPEGELIREYNIVLNADDEGLLTDVGAVATHQARDNTSQSLLSKAMKERAEL